MKITFSPVIFLKTSPFPIFLMDNQNHLPSCLFEYLYKSKKRLSPMKRGKPFASISVIECNHCSSFFIFSCIIAYKNQNCQITCYSSDLSISCLLIYDLQYRIFFRKVISLIMSAGKLPLIFSISLRTAAGCALYR